MDKKTLLAFALSFLILFGWSFFFKPEQDQKPHQEKSPVVTSTEKAAPLPEKATAPPARPLSLAKEMAGKKTAPIPEKEIRVETPLYIAVFSNVGATIKSFKLKRYRETVDKDSPPIELVNVKKGMGDFLRFGFADGGDKNDLPLTYESDRSIIQVTPGSAPALLRFRSLTSDKLMITQVYRFYPDQYRIDLQVQVENLSQASIERSFQTILNALPPEGKKSYYSYIGLMALSDGKLKKLKIKKKSTEQLVTGNIGWFAYENGYFMSAVVPETPVNASFTGHMLTSGVLSGRFQTPPVKVAPSEKVTSSYLLYLGPHELETLKHFGKNLDKAVNFGWTDIIARPLLYLLRFCHKYVHNYGIAIILLTILIKILFWPLTHKSYKSMKEMQKLQPRLAKLREKYKGNKEAMNKEMMALYKTYKVNPMGGCLPMVIQIPVFFALYRILGDSIELRHAPFMLWINDLSAPDRLFHFAFKVPFMSPPYGIPVLTLLMGASMFIQQKMTPTPGDPSQAKIMMFLPIIFTVMFINFPSGLVLYWLVNNILSIGQQYRIHRGSA
jgi:YidC/Oxa1 family membrane protein insertase